MSEGTPDDLWTPVKNLHSVVSHFLSGQADLKAISNLEFVLRKNKPYFVNLLRNPPKCAKNREEIKRGITEGVTIPGLGHTILSRDLVDESIILSDMYDLNEFVALDLLCTAQQQMSHHPGIPRGLVAVLLYYDGRKTLVSTLKDLFQARSGVAWECQLDQEIVDLITHYTDNLVAEGILNRIFHLLETLDFSKENEILTTNRALGPPKHCRQVIDLFEEIRLQLSIALFNYSAQCGLPRDVTLRLFDYMSRLKPNNARGRFDKVGIANIMTVLYALDVGVLKRREDSDDPVINLPIIKDPQYCQAIKDGLTNPWCCEELKSLALFAFGLVIASLKPLNNDTRLDLPDAEDRLVEEAIQKNLFDFLHYSILESEEIYKIEFYYRRIHNLMTDFIELMPSKVKELRARADETARAIDSNAQQGLEPPRHLCRNFELLMLSIGKLYENDKLHLNLSHEFWNSTEITHTSGSTRSVSLFKFIRLAGELLPPILFVPYLRMLSGLANNQDSARNVFNLFKPGGGISTNASLSWDHFFNSLAQYYNNLRQEQKPGIDTIYRNRNINPHELLGLEAVLELVRVVADHDDSARIAFCEHPSWTTLAILLGLTTCSVPIHFKAALINTLASLGKSKETAIQLWTMLENSQIITTIPSTATFSNRGIESDLEQNECRNESYPLTQAILNMLITLVSTAVPPNLGAGQRKPGLDPYVTFVIESVLLKVYNRNYKDEAEKWKVAEKCLELIYVFVKNYELSPADFPVSGTMRNESTPPGFHVMLQMNLKSDLLSLIFYTLDEACQRLEKYYPFPGKNFLEKCALRCLEIIERCLECQDMFQHAHITSNSSTLLAGLNKLLLGINSRSGKPDHLLNIIRFVVYNSWLPEQALHAIRIISAVIRQPNVNGLMMDLLCENDRLAIEIRQGFVECLESDVSLVNDARDSDDEFSACLEIELKEAIIKLLNDTLPQPIPNLSHFLLGFEFSKLSKQSNIPDVPRTCIKSLVILLDNNEEDCGLPAKQQTALRKLMSLTYNLFFALSANPKTSDITLRYLRSNNDFLRRHVQRLPFKNTSDPLVLNQMGGLLRNVAIELRLTANNNQISQFNNLAKVFLGHTQKSSVEESFYGSLGNSVLHQTITSASTMIENAGHSILVLDLLNCLNFELDPLDKPKWKYFDNSRITQLYQSCEVRMENGPKLINVKKLHDVLKEDLSTVQGTISFGQKESIIDEIKDILDYGLKVNEYRNTYHSTTIYLESWGQLVEILFSVAPPQALSMETRQMIILEILQVLLKKVMPIQSIPEVQTLASSTVLQLLINLRNCYSRNYSPNSSNRDLTLPDQLDRSRFVASTPSLQTLSLKYILNNIVEWIIQSSVASQKLRVNLYASLLNFMHILKDSKRDKEKSKDSQYISRLDKSISLLSSDSDEQLKHLELVREVFRPLGNKIIDVLCHDCIGSHDICRMLALACVDILLELDCMSNMIQFISLRGYLSHLIDGLMKSDRQLCLILEVNPENMKALYVYESQMAMLARIANSYEGAELLLEYNAMGVLSTMKVFDLHPDFQLNIIASQYSPFIPTVSQRYQQILFPALNLADIILSTLGCNNHSAVTQIIYFLLSHGDMIEIVLRAGTPHLNLGLLKELSSLTGLIARTTNQGITEFIEYPVNKDLGAQLYRLRKLMMMLFPRFILQLNILKDNGEISDVDMENNEDSRSECVTTILQIASNLSLYARNSIANHTADHRSVSVLFSPYVSEMNQKGDSRIVSLEIVSNIDVVISQLKSSVKYFIQLRQECNELTNQKNTLPTVNLDTTLEEKLQWLSKRIAEKNSDLELCNFIIEHNLYLLWAHLDFYMYRAIPINTMHLNQDSSTIISTYANEAGWKVTKEDLSTLKKVLIQTFNETFSKQLVSTAQDQSTTEKGYIEALVRRIKHIIQFVPVQ